MARATITSWAVARGIHNAARRAAQTYLPDSGFAAESSAVRTQLQSVLNQSWAELKATGMVKEFSAPMVQGPPLRLVVAYMGHYLLGELLIGAADYSLADRTASGMIDDGHMLLIGLDDNVARLEQSRLGIWQDGTLYPNSAERVVFAGTAAAGRIAGQVQMAIAMFTDPDVDITRPFRIVYDTGERRGDFTEFVGVVYALPPAVLDLVTGQRASGFDQESLSGYVPDVTSDDTRPSSATITWSDLIPAAILLALLIALLHYLRFRRN